MIEKKIVYFYNQSFQDAGITTKTLQLAMERVVELRIKRVILSSSSGDTALKAVEIFEGKGVELIVVSDRAGVKFTKSEYKKYGERFLPHDEVEELLRVVGLKEREEIKSGLSWKPEVVKKLEKKGMKVVIASEPLRAMLPSRVNPDSIVVETLSLFGKGIKVAVEVALAACDAGLIDEGEEVVTLGGFTKGVDTALVVRACHRDEMFLAVGKRIQIREIICKPRLK